MTIKSEKSIKYNDTYPVYNQKENGKNGINFMETVTKIKPVKISTIGYCKEILLLHLRHLHPCIK